MGRRRGQPAPQGVSSVVSQSDSERDADYADLAGWLACAAIGNLSTGMEYMRRLDARSVAAGQMAREEFLGIWNTDPYEILTSEANRSAACSTLRGGNTGGGEVTRYQAVVSVSNAPEGSRGVGEGRVPEQ